jgi:hypothetical protein
VPQNKEVKPWTAKHERTPRVSSTFRNSDLLSDALDNAIPRVGRRPPKRVCAGDRLLRKLHTSYIPAWCGKMPELELVHTISRGMLARPGEASWAAHGKPGNPSGYRASPIANSNGPCPQSG